MTIFVEIISAPWCKRCHAIKPRVADMCRIAGATLAEVNFDEIPEDDPLKSEVTALPTIRLREPSSVSSNSWKSYTPAQLAAWEDQMQVLALNNATEQDF